MTREIKTTDKNLEPDERDRLAALEQRIELDAPDEIAA